VVLAPKESRDAYPSPLKALAWTEFLELVPTSNTTALRQQFAQIESESEQPSAPVRSSSRATRGRRSLR
jgi:hypothetical protein